MLEINVKTIDGQSRSYSVPDDYTVRQFKEKITSSLNIPVDRQRLIFQGRELKDNNSLSEFDVNGKTLHLVQRAPPTANDSQASTNNTSSQNAAGASAGTPGGLFSALLGGGGTQGGQPDVQRLVQQLIGGIGQNATGTTTTTDQNGMEVQIDINNVSQQANENEIRARIRNIRRFLSLAQSRLNRLAEINSGAPLEDTSGSIIIGSIHGTAQLSDANGTLGTFGFDIPNLNYAGIDIQNILSAVAEGTSTTPTTQPQPEANSQPAQEPAPPAPSSTPAEVPEATDRPNSTEPSADSAAESTETTNTQSTSSSTQESQNISVEVLADVIQSVMTSYSTFLPYLQQYHEMLINDENEPPESPTPNGTPSTPNLNVINNNNSNIIVLGGGDNNRRQRFCNNINDMMHLLGHLFHNLSDLHINIRDRPPRQIHTMNSMQHSASAIISARPVEANIQIPLVTPLASSNNQPTNQPTNQPNNSSTNTTTHSTTSDNTTTSTSPPDNIATSNNQPDNTTTTTNPSTYTTFTTHTTSTSNPTLQPGPANPPQPRPTANPSFHRPPFGIQHHYHHVPPRIRNSHSFSHPPRFLPQRPTFVPGAQAAHVQAHRMAHEAALARSRAMHHGVPRGGHRFNFPHGPAPRPNPMQFPMPTPLGANASSASSYDPFLPCNSVHFYNTVNSSAGSTGATANGGHQGPQRRRHPAGDQRNAQPTATTTTTSSNTTNPVGTPMANSQGQATNIPMGNNGDIGRLITNVISQISGGSGTDNSNQQIQVNIGGVPGQISISSLSTNIGESRNRPENAGNPFNLQQLLGGALGARPPGSSGNAPPNNSAQTVNSLIREAINLMDSDNTNDQRLNQPLTGLLGMTFGEDEDDEGWRPDSNVPPTSTLSIFNVLFSSMTLGDMINLARGSNRYNVFERSRQPLRDHIKRFFLTPESTNEHPLNEENQSALVDRMYNEVFIDEDGLNLNLAQFELTDAKIDFPKSFEKLIKHHLKILLQHVFDTTYDNQSQESANNPPGTASADTSNTWSSLLFKKFHNLIEKMVLLTRFCVKNADVKFTQVVTSKLRQAVTSMNIVNNPMFYGIFENFISTQVQQTLASITETPSNTDIPQFVVYKTTDKSEAGTSSTQASQLSSINVEDMEEDERFDSASSTLSDMDIDTSFNEYKKKLENAKLTADKEGKSKVVQSKLTETEVKPSKSTSWRDNVPSEWLAEIERDIKAQNEKSNTRGPFSDAYCSAMPAKRRKVFTARSDLQDKNIFKKVLCRTLEKIQLKQSANPEELIETTMANSQLVDSFSSEFNSGINERLRNDSDFNQILKKEEDTEDMNIMNKNRFPHAKKRFK